MIERADRRQDRIEERESARASVAAVMLADACLHVTHLPVIAIPAVSHG